MRSTTLHLARAAVVLGASLLPLAVSVPAQAASDNPTAKTVSKNTACTRDLERSGSSKARLIASGYSYVDADLDSVTISRTRARVVATTCSGTSDNGVSVGKMTVKMTWTISSSGLGSCSVGLPSGFSCTIDRKETTISRSYSCKNVSKCSKLSVDDFTVPTRPGYKVLAVTYQESFSGKQPKKDAVRGSTNVRTWTP